MSSSKNAPATPRRFRIRQFKPQIRRTPFGAWLGAFFSARAGEPTGEYVKLRGTVYSRKQPQLKTAVPAVGLGGDEIVVQHPWPAHPLAGALAEREAAAGAGDREGSIQFLRLAGRNVEAQTITQSFLEADQDLAAAREELRVKTAKAEALKAELERAIAAGEVPTLTSDLRTTVTLWRSVILVLLLIEAWWYFDATANSWGVDGSDLSRALSSEPLRVVGIGSLAVAVVGTLFMACRQIAEHCEEIVRGLDSRRELMFTLGKAVLWTLLVAGICLGSAAMRARLSEGGQALSGAGGSVGIWEAALPYFMSLGLPFGAALVERLIRPLVALRELRRRHDELLRRAGAEMGAAGSLVESIKARIVGLEDRLREAEAIVRYEIDLERRFVEAWVAALVAALTRDLNAHRRASRRRGFQQKGGAR